MNWLIYLLQLSFVVNGNVISAAAGLELARVRPNSTSAVLANTGVLVGKTLQANSPAPSPTTPSPTPSTPTPTTPAPSPKAATTSPFATTVQSLATQIATTVKGFITSRPALTVEKLKAAEYYFLAKGPIKLVNGKYEDPETKRSYEMGDVVAYGDLNQDGFKDAVSALKVTVPTSGDFSYLVAVVNALGEPKNISTEFLGPQIKVKSLTIKPDTSIEALLGQYQPGDPACCPRVEITRTYKFREQQAEERKDTPAPKQ